MEAKKASESRPLEIIVMEEGPSVEGPAFVDHINAAPSMKASTATMMTNNGMFPILISSVFVLNIQVRLNIRHDDSNQWRLSCRA